MTQEEALKCRQAAQLYRALQKENQMLRMELEEKQRIDLRMYQEDKEVFALVNLKVTSINWNSFQQTGTDWYICIKENTQEFLEILGCLTEILNIS